LKGRPVADGLLSLLSACPETRLASDFSVIDEKENRNETVDE
jgi:hypothetical protein